MSDSRNSDDDKLFLEAEEPEKLLEGDALGADQQTGVDVTGEETSGEESAEAEPTVEQLQEQLAQVQKEYEQEHDLYLRAVAELRNYKRRVAQQQAQQMQYANESLLTALLPVLDHFELALQSAGAADEPADQLTAGIRMVYQQLMDVLGQFGLEPIEAAGENFNPDLHQAAERQPVEPGDPAAGMVIAQLRQGYRLHERVLQPAQVKVAVADEANNTE